jgi:DsbC/DsbD-like thiol-disulfide interchange protein
MKRILVLAVFLISSAAVNAAAQTVTGSIANVSRGGTARGSVVLSIPDGLHVNSNRPDSEYAIPTSVRLSANGARVSGVTYPRGKNKKFAFSQVPINIYDGRVVFPFTVTVPKGFKGNTVRVTAAVRYQACTDEVCYPPRTKNITLNARVR